jgi:hypothetical protein
MPGLNDFAFVRYALGQGVLDILERILGKLGGSGQRRGKA